MLSPEQRVRHARHRSLFEVGDEGVERLLTSVVTDRLADARAESVRAEYLRRAGLALADDRTTIDAATSAEVARLAGRPELDEAAAFLVGALHAVDRFKAIVGVGQLNSTVDFELSGRAGSASTDDPSSLP